MDDVAVVAKVATKKTAGILGDDLAVNAEKATGFLSSREIPVLWAITKGSMINKVIIVPIAILLNVFLPVAIIAILILGGFYLAYEGVEKIIEYFFHRKKAQHQEVKEVIQEDPEAEKKKVKSAVVTDFILSVEIVIIALGTVLNRDITMQAITVSVVAILATVGVYGIVAVIVRMDDLGYKLIKRSNEKGFFNALGILLVKALPVLIKVLSVVGTIALILVSGGIFSHNIHFLHDLLPGMASIIKEFLLGTIAGLIAFAIVSVVAQFRK